MQQAHSEQNLLQNPYVPNVRFELIPIRELVSSQEYQRQLSEAHILRAIEDFDVHQINPVKVSCRDGINYVFDGQHTIEIVAGKSQSRDTPVWCMVYEDLSYSTEANIFAEQQNHVKPLLPYEIFIAHIEANDEKYLTIQSLIQSYNLRIGCVKSNGVIGAVGTIEDIYDRYGYHVLDRTLFLCVGTWEGEANSLSASILKAIARLIVTYGDALKDDLFKERVGQLSVKNLSRNAKERRPGALGYAEVMVMQYNKRAKYCLPMKNCMGLRDVARCWNLLPMKMKHEHLADSVIRIPLQGGRCVSYNVGTTSKRKEQSYNVGTTPAGKFFLW